MHGLARRLCIPRYRAIAIVEMLHHFAAKYTLAGDVGRYDDEALAAAVEWDGDPHELIAGLIAKGSNWLDPHPEHRLVVHDWPDHCDPFVHMALARAKQTFADGTIPKRARISGKEREQLDLFWSAFERQQQQPVAGIQGELIPDQSVRAHGVRTACALPPPPPPPSPIPERESDARARGFGPGEEIAAPEQLGAGERAAILAWATIHAPSRKHRVVELEQACLLHARSNGKTSSDWIAEVKLWILRQGEFDRQPVSRAAPTEEARAASRERSQRAELEAATRRAQLDPARSERASPEVVEECMSRYRRRGSGAISLSDYVDRRVARS